MDKLNEPMPVYYYKQFMYRDGIEALLKLNTFHEKFENYLDCHNIKLAIEEHNLLANDHLPTHLREYEQLK